MFSWWLTKCSEIVVLLEGNRASLTVWEKRAFNNSNTAQRFIRPLIRRADKVGRDQTPQTSLGVIPITEKWTIPLTGPWKEEVQSRGSLKNSWVWAELAWRWGRKERNESVVTWRCLTRTGAMWWCHWETAGEWKEDDTIHRAWTEDSCVSRGQAGAKGVRQATGAVRLEDASLQRDGLQGRWHNFPAEFLPRRTAPPVVPDLPFLQEKPEVQLSYVKALNSLMLAINFSKILKNGVCQTKHICGPDSTGRLSIVTSDKEMRLRVKVHKLSWW